MIIVTIDFSLYIDYINDYLGNNIDWDLNRNDCPSLGMLMLVVIITDINKNDYICYNTQISDIRRKSIIVTTRRIKSLTPQKVSVNDF